jgi:amino acid permease
MAALYFSRFGLVLFYISMILYLYGDLAIYDAAVPKSLRDTTCTFYKNLTNGTHLPVIESDRCWSSVNLTRLDVYRIYVVGFNLLIGALVFYNTQKTKLLQLCTTLMRWIAFITMIVLAIKHIIENKKITPQVPLDIKMFNIKGLPNFFGVCIYAFMCHHSLPSIITPIKSKKKFIYMLLIAYICILIFYLLLSFTGVFAFGKKLEDFYTLNFEPSHDSTDSLLLTIIKYYLSLFPVFTISASFPIIAITLRNNLIGLYNLIKKENVNPKVLHVFPLITLIPPLIISLITHDLQLLVGITGSYAGVCIQYIFPALLVYFGRRESIRHFHTNFQIKQEYRSPFKSKYWVYFVLLWAHVSVIFVTLNHIINKS